jgi:hypothetical protein
MFFIAFLFARLAAIPHQRLSFTEPTLSLFCMLNSDIPSARIGQALIDILKKHSPSNTDFCKILIISAIQLVQKLQRESRLAGNAKRICNDLVQEITRWNASFDGEFSNRVLERLRTLDTLRSAMPLPLSF